MTADLDREIAVTALPPRERHNQERDMFNRQRGIEDGGIVLIVVFGLLFLGGIVLVGCPTYNVYKETKSGEAELARAESNRRIAVLEAQAKMDGAKLLAGAEVERAKGVAEANKIIGEGLKGHEEYLRYLWIIGLEHVAASPNGSTVVYVPTEGSLPIMEAGRAVPRVEVQGK